MDVELLQEELVPNNLFMWIIPLHIFSKSSLSGMSKRSSSTVKWDRHDLRTISILDCGWHFPFPLLANFSFVYMLFWMHLKEWIFASLKNWLQVSRQRTDLWLPRRRAVGKEWIGSLELADGNYCVWNEGATWFYCIEQGTTVNVL